MGVIDLRPLLIMPGLVDLHAHLPQWPNAGLGAGLDLLTWLKRYVFPLEREFHADAARRLAPLFFQALAAAGTTTVLAYGAVFEDSTDVAFAAAEEHGIRLILGKVMMDRLRYDEALADSEVLDQSLAQSQRLIERWHGRDEGRLPIRGNAALRGQLLCGDAARLCGSGARQRVRIGRPISPRTATEIDEVKRLFPEALDYTDVYDRAGALGPRSIVAHAVHLDEREVRRLAETGTRIAHCPSSNLFLASGAMPLAHYMEAGIVVGLGCDVAGGPDVSLFGEMRAAAFTQSGRRTMLGDAQPPMKPFDWLRLGSLEGARALGIDSVIGSIEAGQGSRFHMHRCVRDDTGRGRRRH